MEEKEKAETQETDPPVTTDEQNEEVDQMSEIFQSVEPPVFDDVHVHSFDQDDHLEGQWDGEIYVLEDDNLSEMDWDSWNFE